MKNIDIYTIQNRLDALREEKKVSQKKIIEFLGISKQGYINYKTNKNVMGSDVFIKMGSFLNVDFNKLIYDNQDPDISPQVADSNTDYKKKCNACEQKDAMIHELIKTIGNLNEQIEMLKEIKK